MNKTQEVLKLALAVLKEWRKGFPDDWTDFDSEAVTAIREALAEQPAQKESVRLRRGDILRCIETDELCTVWSTSTTGRTLIKWSEGSFGNYTAEQIGDLFWLEPEPDDLELAAEKSDNYAAFHAGYRFAVARSLAEQPAQQHIEHCIWARNGNAPCPHVQPAQQQESLSRVDVACDIKTLCANGDLPDRFEEVAEWVAAGAMPAQQQEDK